MLNTNLVKLDSTKNYIIWLDPEFAEQYDDFKLTLEQYNEESKLKKYFLFYYNILQAKY